MHNGTHYLHQLSCLLRFGRVETEKTITGKNWELSFFLKPFIINFTISWKWLTLKKLFFTKQKLIQLFSFMPYPLLLSPETYGHRISVTKSSTAKMYVQQSINVWSTKDIWIASSPPNLLQNTKSCKKSSQKMMPSNVQKISKRNV